MSESGFILLHKNIAEWEWFKSPEVLQVFIYLLVKANFTDTLWQGKELKRGQLIASLDRLKAGTGLSVQTLRTCLSRLEKSGEINKVSTSKFSIITVCKYDIYNAQLTQKRTKPTSSQQAKNDKINKPANKQDGPNNEDLNSCISTPNGEYFKLDLTEANKQANKQDFSKSTTDNNSIINKEINNTDKENIKENPAASEEGATLPVLVTADELEKKKNSGKKEKPSIDNPFGDGFLPTWDKWKAYKKAHHRFAYKTDLSENAALAKLAKLADNNPAMAKEIIEQSIGEGWSGLFELRAPKGQQSQQKPKADKFDANLKALHEIAELIGVPH